jgi:hypothetical protein
MELAVSVTVTMTGEDGSACLVGGELAAALAGSAELPRPGVAALPRY